LKPTRLLAGQKSHFLPGYKTYAYGKTSLDFNAYYRLLSENQALLTAVMAFNEPGGPAGGLPELSGEGAPWAEMLAEPSLRGFFPRAAHAGLWDFTEESRRLALIDPQSFHRACLHWGAAVYADDLARVIARDEVLGLIADIGLDVYSFILNRGLFYLGSLRESCRSGQLRAAGLTAGTLKRAGLRAAALFARRWPEELRAKAAGKFALEEFRLNPEPADGGPLADGLEEKTWRWFKKILLEVAPQWRPCFD
jgi:hypothetical protein